MSFSAQTSEMLEPEEISSSRYHQLSKILQQSKKYGGADSTLSIRTHACPMLGLKHVAAVAAVTLVSPREESWRHPWLRGQHFGVTSTAPTQTQSKARAAEPHCCCWAAVSVTTASTSSRRQHNPYTLHAPLIWLQDDLQNHEIQDKYNSIWCLSRGC